MAVWNEPAPWLEYSTGELLDADGDLRLPGQKIEIRWVFQTEQFAEDTGDFVHFRGLAYDRGGTFYAIKRLDRGRDDVTSKVERLTGKQALSWFVKNASWDAPFQRELCRAIDNPEFEFMALMPTRELAKRTRKARKRAEVFHEQLHLATALVECVRKLDAQPTLENLAEACRSASAVHTAIHAPENFKLAAN